MRLLDAKTLKFVEFLREDETPEYAILSHTWEEDEVTYNDMCTNRAQAESKKGFQKILKCATQTVKDGLEYFWIDTCCIDKSSSSELSEAINSMFRWYRNSQVCYAYLADTPFYPLGLHPDHEIELRQLEEIPKSRWFSRGWTLQELIAPRRVVFISREWWMLGTKAELCRIIETRTKIPVHVLVSGDYSRQSVAQRMSWAAYRQTTRVEDEAYCLLGLFDIHMPLLYGEGEKAFIRLQQEIIKESDDASIFAWEDPNATWYTYRGLFASSVSYFATCSYILWVPPKTAHSHTFKSTNKGIKMKVDCHWMSPESHGHDIYVALLPDIFAEDVKTGRRWVGIRITDLGQSQYARLNVKRLELFDLKQMRSLETSQRAFYVRQRLVLHGSSALIHSRAGGLIFNHSKDFNVISISPKESWDEETGTIYFPGPWDIETHRIITIEMESSKTGNIALRIDTRESSSWQRPRQLLDLNDATGNVILQICTFRILHPRLIDNNFIHAGLTSGVSESPCARFSLFRGLVGDRWMFRLEVVTDREAIRALESMAKQITQHYQVNTDVALPLPSPSPNPFVLPSASMPVETYGSPPHLESTINW